MFRQKAEGIFFRKEAFSKSFFFSQEDLDLQKIVKM